MSIPKRFLSYEVPDEHLQLMLRMCNLQPEEELPPLVREEYIKNRIASDRIQLTLSDADLVRIVVAGSYKNDEKVPEQPPITIVEMWKSGQLQEGARVFVTWRNKKNRPATVIGMTKDLKIVIREIDKDEDYKVDPNNVYLEPIK